jgi:hypothetical protein
LLLEDIGEAQARELEEEDTQVEVAKPHDPPGSVAVVVVQAGLDVLAEVGTGRERARGASGKWAADAAGFGPSGKGFRVVGITGLVEEEDLLWRETFFGLEAGDLGLAGILPALLSFHSVPQAELRVYGQDDGVVQSVHGLVDRVEVRGAGFSVENLRFGQSAFGVAKPVPGDDVHL